MENFLKYFEIKYAYNELFMFNTTEKNVTSSFSISKSLILQNFFKHLLEYYTVSSHDILIDYTDISNTDDIKDTIVKKLFKDDAHVFISKSKSIKIFDMVDFMFKTFKKVIMKYNKGYLRWLEDPKVMKLKFSSVIVPNIDLFFYIVFVHSFPTDLRDILKKELKISDLEHNILNKCSDILIKDYKKVCNVSDGSYISLKDPSGILMIMKIFNDFRQFNQREPNTRDTFDY